MGLFHRKKAKEDGPRPDVEAAKARLARRLEEEMWAEEDLRESERNGSLPKRSTVQFNLDIPGFPFTPGTYMGAQDHIDDEGAEVRGICYADSTAVGLILETVNVLVRRLNALTPMSRICADLSNVHPVEDAYSYMPEHYAWMYINPPTPSGKEPKYIASIEFIAGLERPRHMTLEELGLFMEEHPSPEQSSGKIDYLPDGRVGKARLSLWDKPYFYVAYFKLVANELVVSRCSRSFEGKTEVIYRLD